jgi:MFS family permease
MQNKAQNIPSARLALILLVVFCAGYLVMALEILAFRISQIYFGTSIYATGAVLGIVLAALTLGYWLGGALSVKYPPAEIQFMSLFIAGLFIFIIAGIPQHINDLFLLRENPQVMTLYHLAPLWKTVSEWIIAHPVSESLEFRMRFDPLIGSLLLFAIPSFLLATVGPCAIRDLTRDAKQAGRVSGWVFAIGSLGSIAGVMVTSFWLIAVLGIDANLRLIGTISILMAIVAFTLYRSFRR